LILIEDILGRPYNIGMNNAQLTFGLMSGVEKAAPFAEGNILVKRNGLRLVVTRVERDSEACEPEVIFGIALVGGAEVITFPREIAYRSR
jgi:hypothetical protein